MNPFMSQWEALYSEWARESISNLNSQTFSSKSPVDEIKNLFMSSCEKYHNERLDRELKEMWQDERHRDAMFVARLKLEYKNVENITSLCKVTIL